MPDAVHAPPARATKSGVSLIVVLGILLLISMVVLSFVRVTHDSRDTAQLAVERLRSDHLLHAALGRAMDDVNARLAGRLFYWDIEPLVASGNTLVSTNGTPDNCCRDLISPAVLAECPSCLTNEVVLLATNACQWIPMDGGPSGRYAYVVVNISGFLDANAVGGMPSSNRTAPAEMDLSPLFFAPPGADLAAFFLDRTNHVRYETRQELLRLNHGLTNLYDDPLTVFSHDPDRDLYFDTTYNIGTRLFATNLCRKLCVTNILTAGDRSNLVSVLARSVTNADFVANSILDYQDPDRFSRTNSAITEAIPLLSRVGVTNDTALSNTTVALEFLYPFYPPPGLDDSFRIVVSASTDRASTYWVTPFANFNFTTPTVYPFAMDITPGSNLNLAAEMQWKNPFYTTNWFTQYSFRLQTSETLMLAIDDPRLGPETSRWTNATYSFASVGLPIYLPDRPMQNIGELGYVWNGQPWTTLDLTLTNVAALIDRLTVRKAPRTQRGLLNPGTTVTSAWETLFSSIPIGITNSTLSTATTTSLIEAGCLARPLAGRTTVFARNYSELLSDIGGTDYYKTGFLAAVSHVHPDLKEDLLRGIVELISFRHQLYLVVAAAQTLGADGRAMTAERRGMALVWRDGYTGQYFVRNFRWITE